MTLVLALRCADGLVLATDGKVTRASASFRTVARIWQRANKTRVIPPGTLVAGAGELALIHEVTEALEAGDEAARKGGARALAPLARDALVKGRAEAIARYNSLYGPGGIDAAPKAYFILVSADPEPAIVYVSEDGDIEDQTHLGYAAIGTGDLIVHVRMQPYDPARLTMRQGAILAFGLIKDIVDSGTFSVSDPVHVWSIAKGSAPVEWDDTRLTKLAEEYNAFRDRVHDLLRES